MKNLPDLLKCKIFQEIVPINLVLKTTKDILSDKLVKTAVKMMTTQRKRKLNINLTIFMMQVIGIKK